MRPAAAARSAVRVVHPSLDPLVTTAADAPFCTLSTPLSVSRLTDRQRLAVVLQAAGLLSLLDRAGWRPPSDWPQGLRVGSDGGLVVAGAAPGRPDRHPQELLRELLAHLFHEEEREDVAGRGAARRACRSLLDRWRQSLAPLPADEAVSQILEAAPFLWEPAFAAARRALAGELHDGIRPRLWVAGPAGFRARLLAAHRDPRELAPLQELLAGPEARALWRHEEEGDPRDLAAAGRWRAAAAAWERRPPATEAERIERARVLASLGRFTTAVEALEGASSAAAAVVRARCQLLLGQLRPARATLRRLELTPLSPGETVEMAEIAARVYANSGDLAAADVWVRRAVDCATGSAGLRARLAAAAAAWDRGDRAEMDRHLAGSENALIEPELAWRWHHLQGLRAYLEGDGAAMAGHLSRALRVGRRWLARHEAAGLWNDLGLGRAQAGDLAGAERAFLHVLRLQEGCDGPRRSTLALHNLAEIRLRRGRFAGVRDILERSTAENRLSGNRRGLAQDLELWARFELSQGRAAAALALCREAAAMVAAPADTEVPWRREEVAVLAARALGWLGKAAEAAAELAGVTAAAVAEQLEPEERPALWAHAGLAAAARDAVALDVTAIPWSPLWQGLLSGGPLPAPAWEALDDLEPYRAARLVFDAELLLPGAAPPDRLRAAAAALRGAGAVALAGRLEARDGGPWQALAAYAARHGAGIEAVGALLAGGGCPEAELVWTSTSTSSRSERRVVLAGAGGGQELTAAVAGGTLTLRAPRLDPILEALFALIARDITHDLATVTEEPPLRPVPAGGIVGESPELRVALDRIARLAAGDLSVLILGESGTGKELAARQLHRASARSSSDFVPVNCAALSETLLLSDLFGHARGAFTGADRDRAGVFEAAHRGTVFLDEIGDLPAAAQGMLLRVLQEGEVRRLGESLPRRVDVRVVAATHRDLGRMVREGTFRQDLFYRLKVGSVMLPPLRDRGQDVLLLADHALARLRLQRPVRLSHDARASLLAHRWPGNVRELQNVLSVAATLAAGGVIEPVHLELPQAVEDSAAAYHREIEAFRRRLIERELTACGGNLAEAARRLGMTRQGLSYHVRKLRLG